MASDIKGVINPPNSDYPFLQQKGGGQNGSHTSERAAFPGWRKRVSTHRFSLCLGEVPGIAPVFAAAASVQISLKDNFFWFTNHHAL